MNNKEPKVTGVGGIFFKTENPEKMKGWYAKNLGLVTDKYGSTFEFRNANNPEEINYLQWSPFPENTDYFSPSTKEFMVNYRVQNLEGLLEKFKKEGVKIVGEMQTFDYGKFAHIVDPEGNKIELWEPVDQVFTDSLDGNTTK